jgi:hypothetical protein
MGKRGPQPIADRTLLLTTAYPIYCDFWAMAKGERRAVLVKQVDNNSFHRGVNLPAEPDTIVALFEAQTVKQVRAICRRSTWMAKQPASYLARCLPMFARRFLDAKNDRHYPDSDRKSSIRGKFWFVARFLAGAMYGLSGRRAMNIIGPGQPEDIFDSLTPEYVVRFRPSRSHSRKSKRTNRSNTDAEKRPKR